MSCKEYKTVSETNKDDKILDSPKLAPSTPNTWYYNPVDVEWQQSRADSLGLTILNNKYVTFKEPRDVSSHAQPTHTHRTLGDGNCFFLLQFQCILQEHLVIPNN